MPEYKTSDISQLEQKVINPTSLFPKKIIFLPKDEPQEARIKDTKATESRRKQI